MNDDVKKLLELIGKEGTDCFGQHSLDFSREEHRECFYEMFGGEEHMKEEYPRLYEAALHTGKRMAGDMKQNDVGSLKNAAMINNTYSEQSSTGASGISCLTMPASRLYMSIALVQDEEVVCRKRGFYTGKEMEQIVCKMDTGELKSQQDDIICVFTTVWQSTENSPLKAETSLRARFKPNESYIDGIKLAHPCYFHGNDMSDLPAVMEDASTKQEVSWPSTVEKRSNTINVAYNRRGSITDVIDYNYPQKIVGGQKEVFLDVQGKVTLSDKYEYEKLVNVFMLLDIIGDGKKGGDGAIKYNAVPKEGIHVYPFKEAEANGFYFVLPTDWKEVIPDSSFSGNKKVYLEAKFEFKCKNRAETVCFYLSSTVEEKEGDNVYILPQIKLKWGCLAKDTRVEMEDGSMRTISELRKGDKIRNTSGTSSQVEDITGGTEEELIFIRVEGYNSLIGASMSHPLMSQEGAVLACHVDPSYRLLMRDGEYHQVKECYCADYHEKVYNLTLSGPHWFYADGFAAGDNVAQGEGEEQSNLMTLSENNDILLEIEKLKKDFGDCRR